MTREAGYLSRVAKSDCPKYMRSAGNIAGALIVGGAALYGSAPAVATAMLGAGFCLSVVSLAN